MASTKRAALKVDKSAASARRGVLPELVSLLLLEREPGWRAFAVDDFVALVILEYGRGWEGLDATAMGTLRGFRERVSLSLRTSPEEQRRRCARYFERFPLPAELLERAATILHGLQQRAAGLPQEQAPGWIAFISESA